jgi:hypothetical protein
MEDVSDADDDVEAAEPRPVERPVVASSPGNGRSSAPPPGVAA